MKFIYFTIFFFSLLFFVPNAKAVLLSEQTDGTSQVLGLDEGVNGWARQDGATGQFFTTPIQDVTDVTSFSFWARRTAGTCGHLHTNIYSDYNGGIEAQSSQTEIVLTSDWQEFTITDFSDFQADPDYYPDGTYNLGSIRFVMTDNIWSCSYAVITSANPVSGMYFNDSSNYLERSLMFNLQGTLGNQPPPAIDPLDIPSLYSLSLTYPVSSQYPLFNLDVGSTEFKFSYRLPNDTFRSNRALVVWQSDYQDFSASNLLEVQDIDVLDSNNTGVIRLPITISSSAKYYEVSIVDNTDSSNIKTSLNFSVNASSTQLSNLRSTDLGFWGNLLRSLVVPSQKSIDDFVLITDDLLAKKPFSYLEEARNLLNNVQLQSTSSPSLAFVFSANGGQTKQLPMIDFDKSSDLSGASAFTLFYNFVKYALWLRFLIYVYQRLTAVFAPHQMSLF